MAEMDVLWGGTVRCIEFDPTRRTLSMDVEVVDGGSVNSWSLILDGVSELTFARPDDNWDCTELTSIAIAPHPEGQRVECEFWTDSNGMTAVCEQVRVDVG